MQACLSQIKPFQGIFNHMKYITTNTHMRNCAAVKPCGSCGRQCFWLPYGRVMSVRPPALTHLLNILILDSCGRNNSRHQKEESSMSDSGTHTFILICCFCCCSLFWRWNLCCVHTPLSLICWCDHLTSFFFTPYLTKPLCFLSFHFLQKEQFNHY